MNNPVISFIGGGNMAQALIGGLMSNGTPAEAIRVADPSEEQRQRLARDTGVRVYADNIEAVRGASAVVLAVKPQVMDQVLASVTTGLEAASLVISVAAGVPIGRIQRGLSGHQRIVRAMPNTPALYRAGVTGLVAAPGVSEAEQSLATQLLEAAGDVVWVDDEAQMDVVTAVSGSGPAYFFALVEQLSAAGQRAGLSPETAARLARQTAYGAGMMLAKADTSAEQLRIRVTSPGGTTAAALESLAENEFSRIIDEAVQAAVRRGRELGAD